MHETARTNVAWPFDPRNEPETQPPKWLRIVFVTVTAGIIWALLLSPLLL